MNENQLDSKNWVKNYSDMMYSVAVYKTGDKELAFDLVQDTFLSALKAQQNFRGDASEKTWLMAILNHKIIDIYRKKNYCESLNLYLETTSNSFDNYFFDDNPDKYGHTQTDALCADWGNFADSSILKKEFHAILQFCLLKLPPKMVPVFMAKYIDEKKPEEICNEFNISSSNYWVVIHRAKLVLRACLEKNWFLSKNRNE